MQRLVWPPESQLPQPTPLVELIARYGDDSSAFQALEPHFALWYAHHDAAVSFVPVLGAWVASGPPLCAPEQRVATLSGFVAAAQRHRRQAVIFGLNAREAHAFGLGVLPLGQEPIFDLTRWSRQPPSLRNMRSQVRRAARLGVTIAAVDTHQLEQAPHLKEKLHILAARWMALHAMPPMGFVVALYPFDHLVARRLWVAFVGGEPVAFASAAPYQNGRAWLIEDIVRARDAPNGTAESLIDTAMESLRADGAQKLSLGLVPLTGPIAPGLGLARTLAQGLYNFEGLLAFKNKFAPTHWEAIVLGWGPLPFWAPAFLARWLALLALLRAFAHGSLLKFGILTLLRGPRPVLMAMVLALLPWTLGLALLPSKTWFSSPWIQGAWFAFDTVLWLLLVLLILRPRRLLRLSLAIATSLDALITLFEVTTFAHPDTLLGRLVRLSAVFAPALASVVLWGAWHRLRVMRGEAKARFVTLR